MVAGINLGLTGVLPINIGESAAWYRRNLSIRLDCMRHTSPHREEQSDTLCASYLSRSVARQMQSQPFPILRLQPSFCFLMSLFRTRRSLLDGRWLRVGLKETESSLRVAIADSPSGMECRIFIFDGSSQPSKNCEPDTRKGFSR